VGVLQKSVGTRVEIWIHLAYLISQQALFGYGTDHLTSVLRPVAFIVFTLPRDNIEAHSLYFELLYRLGAIGLLGFILIMFSIWRVFWSGREQWAVRVAGASLLCLLVYSSTGGFFVFNDLQLRSGFAWIILGIGAGASLRAMKDARRRSSNRQSLWSPLPLTRVGGKPRTG
jgi:O-antigen ligase